MVNIVIKGKIPSKKNSKQIVCRGRFPMLLPSAAFKKWHDVALPALIAERSELSRQTMQPLPKDFAHRIEVTMYAHDARAFDLTNKAESVMDLLVEAGIIADDNCNVAPKIDLRFGGVDRLNPRAEVIIT